MSEKARKAPHALPAPRGLVRPAVELRKLVPQASRASSNRLNCSSKVAPRLPWASIVTNRCLVSSSTTCIVAGVNALKGSAAPGLLQLLVDSCGPLVLSSIASIRTATRSAGRAAAARCGHSITAMSVANMCGSPNRLASLPPVTRNRSMWCSTRPDVVTYGLSRQNVGDGTSSDSSPTAPRTQPRANTLFPTPRPPCKVMTSPLVSSVPRQLPSASSSAGVDARTTIDETARCALVESARPERELQVAAVAFIGVAVVDSSSGLLPLVSTSRLRAGAFSGDCPAVQSGCPFPLCLPACASASVDAYAALVWKLEEDAS